ncbi:hypothetical protein M0813_04510 [Anaeramoeba flamelloides]|uniref:Uncharacterized protein n=1 Tax=Anaeramoeba flamelloides TaxID=1746091 RepID=A0ABQ8XJC2_9EUKA|nr:hypothetical protein M0813_04510 [Anaeramoeba flamelloides]
MSYLAYSLDLQRHNLDQINKKFSGVTSFSERLIMLQKLRPTSFIGLKRKHLEKRFLKNESHNKMKGPIKIKRDCITDLVLLTKKPKKSIERGLATFFKKYFSFENISHYSREWLIFGINTKSSQKTNLETIPSLLTSQMINKLNSQKGKCGNKKEKDQDQDQAKEREKRKQKPKIRISIKDMSEKKEKRKEKDDKRYSKSPTKDYRIKIKKKKKKQFKRNKQHNKPIQTERKKNLKKSCSDHKKNSRYKNKSRNLHKYKYHYYEKAKYKNKHHYRNTHTPSHSDSDSNSNSDSDSDSDSDFDSGLSRIKCHKDHYHNENKPTRKKPKIKNTIKIKKNKKKLYTSSSSDNNDHNYSRYVNSKGMYSIKETPSEESSSDSINSSYSPLYTSYSSNLAESSDYECDSNEPNFHKNGSRKRKKKPSTKFYKKKKKKKINIRSGGIISGGRRNNNDNNKPKDNKSKTTKKNIKKKKKKKYRILIPSKKINTNYSKKQKSPTKNESHFQLGQQSQEVNFQNPDEQWNWTTTATTTSAVAVVATTTTTTASSSPSPSSPNPNNQISLPNFEPETFIEQEDVFVPLFPEQNDSDLMIEFN